jgi:hypothetical protein
MEYKKPVSLIWLQTLPGILVAIFVDSPENI